MDRPLIVVGGDARKKVTFWRKPWERLASDSRPERWVIAPMPGTSRVMVATPGEFKTVVMQGPRSNYMLTASWRGLNEWAKKDGRGGVYMQAFEGNNRFDGLSHDRAAFLRSLGPAVDVVEQDKLGSVFVRTMSIRELDRRYLR